MSAMSTTLGAPCSRLMFPCILFAGKARAAAALPSSSTTEAPRATSSARPTSSSEPSITTFRSSRTGRRFRTTTESTDAFARRLDEDVPADTNNSLFEEAAASDNRALELLRSLYTIASKWGWGRIIEDRSELRVRRKTREMKISLEC